MAHPCTKLKRAAHNTPVRNSSKTAFNYVYLATLWSVASRETLHIGLCTNAPDQRQAVLRVWARPCAWSNIIAGNSARAVWRAQLQTTTSNADFEASEAIAMLRIILPEKVPVARMDRWRRMSTSTNNLALTMLLSSKNTCLNTSTMIGKFLVKHASGICDIQVLANDADVQGMVHGLSADLRCHDRTLADSPT